MYFVGLMSGTSVDAIDTALVDIQDDRLTVIQYHQYSIPDPVRSAIRSINCQSAISDISKLDVILGRLFAEAVNSILKTASLQPKDIIAIGSHGQTVLHLPRDDHPRTLQIGDPNIIAFNTGITTVTDFRRKDIAAGGDGAPLASAFHAWRFRSRNMNRIVLNLGGMANLTILPADPMQAICGFDTGPGNALMDDWSQQHLHRDYDEDGAWAGSGKPDTELLDVFFEEAYFNRPFPKSTGRDDFNPAWLEQMLTKIKKSLPPEDIQASLLELTARSISKAIIKSAPDTGETLLCGGGTHNLQLVKRLQELLPNQTLVSTEQYGLHPDAVEAVTFAWLAKCRLDDIPANIPAVTGANSPVILGGIYQGG